MRKLSTMQNGICSSENSLGAEGREGLKDLLGIPRPGWTVVLFSVSLVLA